MDSRNQPDNDPFAKRGLLCNCCLQIIFWILYFSDIDPLALLAFFLLGGVASVVIVVRGSGSARADYYSFYETLNMLCFFAWVFAGAIAIANVVGASNAVVGTWG